MIDVSNDLFSKFNKKELDELISLIISFDFKLRDKLNIDKNTTFGLEIECEYANWDKIKENKCESYTLVEESSLCHGAELKSSILTDTYDTWIILKEMCELVLKNSILGKNSGGHIHIGCKNIIGDAKTLLNFMKLWAIYEHIILRYSYGEFTLPRQGFYTISKPVKQEYINLYSNYNKGYYDYDDLMYYLSNDKCKSVNFRPITTLGTIEFRCPNGTFNPVIWQNNVNLFVNILKYASSSDFDDEFISKRLNEASIIDKSSLYIYLNDALEFTDLIFDNNLDKIYFLRQYIKQFEIGNKYERIKHL